MGMWESDGPVFCEIQIRDWVKAALMSLQKEQQKKWVHMKMDGLVCIAFANISIIRLTILV